MTDRTYGNIPLSMQGDDDDLSVFGSKYSPFNRAGRDAIRARGGGLLSSIRSSPGRAYSAARRLTNRPRSPRGMTNYGKKLKMTKKAIAARRAYRRRNGRSPRRSPRRSRRSPRRSRRSPRRSPRRGRKMTKRAIHANAKKAMNLHHRKGISLKQAWRIVLKKNGFGGDYILAGLKAAQSELGMGFGMDMEAMRGAAAIGRLSGSRFGMATVCRPGYSPNSKWRKGKGSGQKRCVKDKTKKITVNELQAIAVKNGISIYKTKKGGGYTRTPVTGKALKARLSRAKISYNYGRRRSVSYV